MTRWALMASVLCIASQANADALREHDYILNCSGCHGLGGAGSRAVPALHAMKELAAAPGARAYFIRVPGVAQAPLSDARLAALMNWLVERFTGKSPTPLYTATEVARLRGHPYRDPKRHRETLLDPKPK